MPSFRYRAVAPNGAVIRGEVEASDRAGAAASLQGLGHVLLQLDLATPRSALWTFLSRDISLSRRAGPKMVADLVARLSLLLDAGVALETALAMLGGSEGNATARAEADALLKSVRAGSSLGDAMAARGTTFPALVVAMARAGEASGTLAPTLSRLATHLARAEAVRSAVRSALVYPAILLTTALGSVLIILLVVLPQLEPVFADSSATLPAATAVAFAASRLLREDGWLILAGAATALVLVHRASTDARLRTRRDGAVLKIPMLGVTVRDAEAARLARVLGTLLEGGVGLAPALSLAQPVLGNRVLADALTDVTSAVREGHGLAGPVARARAFPDLVVQLIRIGEATGRLGPMLLRSADLLEADVQHTVDRSLALLVPALTIGMGGLIAGIVSSVMMAVLSVNDMAH